MFVLRQLYRAISRSCGDSMSMQSSRSLSARLLFTLITATASTCDPVSKPQNIPQAPRAAHMASSRSMMFESDGQNIWPTRLQNSPAELFSQNRLGGVVLPKPVGKELYIVFRDRGTGTDTVYKVKNGSGEIMYLSNNNNQMWEITADRQPIIEVSNGRVWRIDALFGDPEVELLKAFDNNDLTLMSKLLNANSNLAKVPYEGGMTLLMLAIRSNRLDQQNRMLVATKAIEVGADINARDINGNTALHYAVFHKNEEITRLLVASLATVNAQNFYGDTPMHVAMMAKNARLANYLALNGASCAIQNGEGQTPIDVGLK